MFADCAGIPREQVYRLAHVEQGAIIPRAVKYQRIMPKLDTLKPTKLIEEQIGKVMKGSTVRNKRLTSSSPDGKNRQKTLGE
jgi:hypothetical protein